MAGFFLAIQEANQRLVGSIRPEGEFIFPWLRRDSDINFTRGQAAGLLHNWLAASDGGGGNNRGAVGSLDVGKQMPYSGCCSGEFQGLGIFLGGQMGGDVEQGDKSDSKS